jgi:carbon storage regulator
MLILTRKQNESIIIGEDIEVKILGIDIINEKVFVGIKAPREINIVRNEIAGKRKKYISPTIEDRLLV